MHKGQWSIPLPDGSFLVAIAHDDFAVCRHEMKKHPETLHLLPSRASGEVVHDEVHALVTQLIAQQPKPVHIALAAGKAGTHHVLDAMYSTLDDPAWSPDGSL